MKTIEKTNKLESIYHVLMTNRDYPSFEILFSFSSLHITYMLDNEIELIEKIEKLTDNKFVLGYIQGSATTSAMGLMVLFK